MKKAADLPTELFLFAVAAALLHWLAVYDMLVHVGWHSLTDQSVAPSFMMALSNATQHAAAVAISEVAPPATIISDLFGAILKYVGEGIISNPFMSVICITPTALLNAASLTLLAFDCLRDSEARRDYERKVATKWWYQQLRKLSCRTGETATGQPTPGSNEAADRSHEPASSIGPCALIGCITFPAWCRYHLRRRECGPPSVDVILYMLGQGLMEWVRQLAGVTSTWPLLLCSICIAIFFFHNLRKDSRRAKPKSQAIQPLLPLDTADAAVEIPAGTLGTASLGRRRPLATAEAPEAIAIAVQVDGVGEHRIETSPTAGPDVPAS